LAKKKVAFLAYGTRQRAYLNKYWSDCDKFNCARLALISAFQRRIQCLQVIFLSDAYGPMFFQFQCFEVRTMKDCSDLGSGICFGIALKNCTTAFHSIVPDLTFSLGSWVWYESHFGSHWPRPKNMFQ
jgi:hypothetical protein